jgi:hypothetical protein
MMMGSIIYCLRYSPSLNESLEIQGIDSIQVEINGTIVDSGFLGYNQLHKLYMDYMAGIDKNSTMR